jgi:uncharacterized protein YegP (UPF0339 family)
MTDVIEIYQRKDDDWGYRILGENGHIMTSSEGYVSAFNANRGAQALVRRLKDVDKNVIGTVDEGTEPELEITTFGTGEPRAARSREPLGAVVDALGMDIVLNNNEVHITVAGPKNKDSYRLVVKGENLTRLRKLLVSAENAVPTKDAYLLSIIERAATYTATPPTIETLVEWVNNDRGLGNNPFDKTNLDADVREVIVDLFFARKIRTDNKKGLVIVEREVR